MQLNTVMSTPPLPLSVPNILPSAKPKKHTVAIQVIDRMFSLLEILAGHAGPVTLKVLSERSGLHPSTAHRILNDLTVGGFVIRHGTGTYKLGLRLMSLGELVKDRLNVQQAGADALKEWYAHSSLPAALWLRKGDALTLAEFVPLKKRDQSLIFAAQDRPQLHASTTGQLFLCHDNAEGIATYANSIGLINRGPEQTLEYERLIKRLERLSAEHTQVDPARMSGAHIELNAPVLDHQNHLVGVISVLAPSTCERANIVQQVSQLSQSLSSALGHQGQMTAFT